MKQLLIKKTKKLHKKKVDREVEEETIKVCDHENDTNYMEINDNKYFLIEYYNTVQYPVFKCNKCSVLFGSKEYKVSSKNPVHCCENAKLSHHPCSVALCKKCYCDKFIFQNESTGRKRKRINIVAV